MRLYGITNMYMSGIHAGIQTQHSTAELFIKYPMTNSATSDKACVISDWAKYYKTTVVLNGGMHDNLEDFKLLLLKWAAAEPEESLPFAPFYEPGVNHALTSISIVVPADAVEFMSGIRSTAPGTPERDEYALKIYNAYGKHAYEVFEKMAFMPLAK